MSFWSNGLFKKRLSNTRRKRLRCASGSTFRNFSVFRSRLQRDSLVLKSIKRSVINGISNNAKVLGIDLSRIDSVVLSHGHYDHSGGLKTLLDCNSDFTLYAHPDVFDPKVKGADDGHKYIGIPVAKNDLEQKGIKIQLDKDPVQRHFWRFPMPSKKRFFSTPLAM